VDEAGLRVGEEEGAVDEGQQDGLIANAAGLAEAAFQGDLLLVEVLDREVFDGAEEGGGGGRGVGKFDIHDGKLMRYYYFKPFSMVFTNTLLNSMEIFCRINSSRPATPLVPAF